MKKPFKAPDVETVFIVSEAITDDVLNPSGGALPEGGNAPAD